MMSQTITKISQTHPVNALDTYNHIALNNSMYVVECDMNVVPTSGLSIVIQQNSSTKLTSIVPAAAQNNINARIILNCAVNDVISVILSSSSAAEAGSSNIVMGILNIRMGSV